MKKVLVITYYWPPSGGGGVQRWLKFTKYLGSYGWDPVIFTPENPAFPFQDQTLEKDVPVETEVIRLPIWEPYKFLGNKSKAGGRMQGQALDKPRRSWKDKLIVWLRGNMMIPDPRIFWVRPASRFLKDLIIDRGYEVMVTTGPPHSMHLIGLKLKKSTGIKWIADFRDPWSEWHQLRHLQVSALVRKWHRRLEKKVLKHADLALTVTQELKGDLVRLGASNAAVITNGYDPEDFPAASQSGQFDIDKFRISHIGTVDDLRDPGPFFRGLKLAIAQKPEIKENLEVVFSGILSASFLKPYLDDPEIGGFIQTGGYMPHGEIFKEFNRSAVLLLILSDFDNAGAYLPGKFFEYAGSGRPILAVAAPDGALGRAIRTDGNNSIIAPAEHQAIAEKIIDLYSAYSKGDLSPSNPDTRYSRKDLAGTLATLLDQLVNN